MYDASVLLVIVHGRAAAAVCAREFDSVRRMRDDGRVQRGFRAIPAGLPVFVGSNKL